MLLKFAKMHGLGNDFVVIDLITQRFNLKAHHVRKLADRHFGIGCDQVLLVEAPTRPDVDFRYRIFNAEGSEVEQCGNGARCFARFVRDRKLTGNNPIRVETSSGVITLEIDEQRRVKVDMGAPRFNPPDIPFIADAQATHYEIAVGNESLRVGAVSMGNPHVVLQVPSTETAGVASLGPLLESHARFPNRVNVGFMEIIDRQHFRLRVYERGVGETLACGTGACAAMAVGVQQGLLDSSAKATLKGGELDLNWQGEGHPVIMTGPATTVFEGQVRI